MHPIFQRANAEHRRIRLQAEAEYAALTGGRSVSELPAAPAPAPAVQIHVAAPRAAPRVPTAAEAETQRIASFSRLSASDQALLTRLGLSPFAPSPSPGNASFAPAVPVMSEYDLGARAAARLFGKPIPAASGEINLAPPPPAPGLDAGEYAKGEAEARRLLGKKAA